MNIKQISNHSVVPLEPKQKVEANSRTVEAHDRDANGRQEAPEKEMKRHLSEVEFQEALKVLSEDPGLKSNQLKIHVEQKDDCRVVIISDQAGNVVRRLSEAQLWASTREKDRSTGRILDKAM